MSGEDSRRRDARLEAFAAELALLAYRVALRSIGEGNWLDLELDLWRALATKVRAWGPDRLPECR